MALGISNSRTKVIGSFWGSDLLRENHMYLKLERIFFYRADALTISTEKMLGDFKLKAMGNYKKHIYTPKFGDEILDTIKKISKLETVNSCKEYYKISPTKITISIGYNGNQEQQQIFLFMDR